MKYRELYERGAELLRAASISEAELDARLLLEWVCHTDRTTLLAHGDREVGREEEKTYESLIGRRAGHEPLQYLTGIQDFMGLTFEVNEDVLIPRQDTETLVEEAMRELHDGMEILDMCTGSGCILLSLLHYSNGCRGLGVDRSEEALEVARRNARRLEIPEGSAEFLRSDLFEAVAPDKKFDMLLSNPPYIKTSEIKTLMPEVRDHEPFMALDGLEDGLYFYRRIAAGAKSCLYAGAMLFLEIGWDQAEAVCGILKAEGYQEIQVKKDLAGFDRVVTGCVPWR